MSDDLYVTGQIVIIKRAAIRGKAYALRRDDSAALDLFQHIEDESERTLLHLANRVDAAPEPCPDDVRESIENAISAMSYCVINKREFADRLWTLCRSQGV